LLLGIMALVYAWIANNNRSLLLIPHSLIINGYCMIKVTRLDGTEYYINPHQIECIEIRPDTTLIMLSGKTHIVREEADDVLQRIDVYRKKLTPYIVQE